MIVHTILVAIVSRRHDMRTLCVGPAVVRGWVRGSRVRDAAVVRVPVARLLLAVLERRVAVALVVDSGGLGAVALAAAELVRVGVLGEGAGVVDSGAPGLLAVEDAAEEPAAALGGVAGGVVVAGRGAEALLLAVVAHEGDFQEDGEDEEESGGRNVSVRGMS